MLGITQQRQRFGPLLLAILVAALVFVPQFAFANVADSIGDSIAGFVYTVCVGLGGWILWLGAVLFDTAVSSLVIGMGEWLNGGLGNAVNELWSIIRDLFNILFIFGLIFIGFKIILNASDTNARRALGMLIVAALLINFSLYFTKLVVDFSNVAAIQIYQLIEVEDQNGVAQGTRGLKDAFLQMLDLQTYNNQEDGVFSQLPEDLADDSLPSMRVIGFGFLVMIFLSVTGFVFAASAILLVVRFIALVALMIFSPILLLGWVLPQFQSTSRDMMHKLISYALVAPAFMFMMYLSLKVTQSMSIGIGDDNRSLAAAMNPHNTENAVELLIYFCVIIGLMILSLFVSKQMGVFGADKAISVGNSMQKRIRTSAQGFVGRNTVGLAADKIDQGLEKRGWSGRGLLRSMTTAGANAKFGSSASRRDMRTAKEEANRKRASYVQLEGKRSKNPITGFKRSGGLVQKINAGVGAESGAAGDAARIEMERAVAGASTDQLLSVLKNKKPTDPEYQAVVAAMSSGQADSILKAKAEEFDDDQKATFAARRSTAINDALKKAAQKAHQDKNPNANPLSDEEALKQGLASASKEQLKALGAETLVTNAGSLTSSQIDDIKKSSDYTETEKGRILGAHKRQVIDQFNSNPSSVFKNKKDKDVAKLPREVLVHPDTAHHITGNALKKIVDEDTLSAEDRATLRKNIEGARNNTQKTAVEYLKSPRGLETF